jgi:signal transduction histidine kinase
VICLFSDISAHKRAEDQLRANAEFQRRMVALALLTNATLDLDELLRQLCQHIATAFSLTNTEFWLLQPDGSLEMTANSVPELMVGTRFPLDTPGFFSGEVVRARRAMYINGYTKQLADTLIAADMMPACLLGAPVLVNKEVIGVITVSSLVHDTFGEEDLPRITQVAAITGGALRNARLYRREQEVAERLRQLEQWRSSFLRVMAHELRTPLGQIMGFTDLLDSETEHLPERGRRYLRNLHQAAGGLEHLVQRSLDVLELFSSAVSLHMAVVDLGAILEITQTKYRRQAEAAGVDLRILFPAEPLPIVADQRRLFLLVSILMDNALKFVVEHGRVEVQARRHDDQAKLTVWNEGTGVPAGYHERIFSEGQVEETLTRQHSGSGTSLLVARRIAELHGGRLDLDASSPGARFVLTLPIECPAAPTANSAPYTHTGGGSDVA